MTDRMDTTLTEAGRRWQATQPPPPAVPLDRLDESARPRTSRRPALLAVAAAAVVVVGATAYVATRSGNDGAAPAGQSSQSVGTTPAGAVPWAALPATHPMLRTYPHGHHRPWVTPYDRVSVTGTIAGRARPGDTLVFTAYLESSTDLRLDQCPDINVAFGTKEFQTTQLNCAQVPYVDSEGHPYLPAFKSVPFEIQVAVPDEPGPQKVLFTIDGPKQLPGFYGIVHVS